MKNLYIVLIAIVFIVLFACTRSFNALAVKSQNVKTAWVPVEGPIARRNDLIRDLLNVAKGSDMSEETVLNELSALRSQWTSMITIDEKIGVASAVDTALLRLLKAIENYPDLSGKEAFSKVMNELPGVSNRIDIEKRKYNEAVRDYNSKVRNFPSSIIADLLRYKLAVEYP